MDVDHLQVSCRPILVSALVQIMVVMVVNLKIVVVAALNLAEDIPKT